MIERLSGEAKTLLSPLWNRWRTFLGKVEARAAEVEIEAAAGLDELVAINPLDLGPISAGVMAVKSRFRGLGTKIEEAVKKLDEEWDEAVSDLEGEPLRMAGLLWGQLQKQESQAQFELEQRMEKLLIRKQADWARVLQGISAKECTESRRCPQCGATFDPGQHYISQNVACPYCKAVNEVHPGMATGLLYRGGGVHHLAQEHSLELWVASREAERRYQRLRCPTDADWQARMAAERAYWEAYYRASQALYPIFTQSPEEMASAKLSHYENYDHGKDLKMRALRGELMRAAHDPAAIKAFMDRQPNPDWREWIRTAIEHGAKSAAQCLLELQHQHERRKEPRAAWVQENLTDFEDLIFRTT